VLQTKRPTKNNGYRTVGMGAKVLYLLVSKESESEQHPQVDFR
jgi:hypothetical protein